MNLQYDAVVIGAGPIGGYITKKIACRGLHVALIEEHKQPGIPLHCAGLVTSRVLDFLGGSIHENIVQNSITGARIHAPSGSILSIGDKTTRALVINRKKFDEQMISPVEKTGTDVFFDTKFTTAQCTTENTLVYTKHKNNEKKFVCNVLIGADGARSAVRTSFRFPQPHEMLQGMGAELTDTRLDPAIVDIFVGNKVAPGFFAWVIPTNAKGTTARVGVCVPSHSANSIKQYFSALFHNPLSAELLHDTNITTYTAGSIPIGPLRRTVDSHVMLVGDAAAQVKPTSGGGLYTGLVCAEHCASVAIDALERKKISIKTLRKYHTLWASEIGKELHRGMRFRSVYTRLSDTQLNMVIEKFKNPKIIDIINTYGDIDYPSKLLMPLLKAQPSLLRFFPFFSNTR